MDELLGREIEDRYRIDDFIAAGGMGAVYRGTQLSVDRTVAIKVIKDGASNEQVAVQRFFREAQSISQLQHPNIVGLVDFGTSDELVYLVMEYVDGFSLASIIEGQYSNAAFVIEALRQIASALAEAHARDLVHRDLKPDNLLVVRLASGHLQFKVVDFGIARMSRFETLSDSGTVIGTPHYMSPEQAQDDPLDGRADLFSLGVIAYEMITGTLPFEAPEPLQVMLKICHEPLPPIRERVDDLSAWPDELFTIVGRLLEKSPEARLTDAATLLERLERVQRNHALEVPRVTGEKTLREVAGPPTSTYPTAPAVPPVGDSVETAAPPAVDLIDELDVDSPRTLSGAMRGLVALVVLIVVGFAVWVPTQDASLSEPVQLAVPIEPPRNNDLTPENPAARVEADPQPAHDIVEDAPVVEPAPESAAAPEPVAKRRTAKKIVEEAEKVDPADPLKAKLDWVKSRPRGE